MPVRISGVLVNPGDLVHADENGVTTIPNEIARDIVAAANDVLEREKASRDWVNSDDFSLEKLRQR